MICYLLNCNPEMESFVPADYNVMKGWIEIICHFDISLKMLAKINCDQLTPLLYLRRPMFYEKRYLTFTFLHLTAVTLTDM